MAGPVPESLSQAGARAESDASNECSIALLPLRNLSGQAKDEPLCAGLTGDIIHSLTRFRDLTVIAQHSALQARALRLPPRALAERLAVSSEGAADWRSTCDCSRRRPSTSSGR